MVNIFSALKKSIQGLHTHTLTVVNCSFISVAISHVPLEIFTLGSRVYTEKMFSAPNYVSTPCRFFSAKKHKKKVNTGCTRHGHCSNIKWKMGSEAFVGSRKCQECKIIGILPLLLEHCWWGSQVQRQENVQHRHWMAGGSVHILKLYHFDFSSCF